jgi:hypothetical protein
MVSDVSSEVIINFSGNFKKNQAVYFKVKSTSHAEVTP